MYKYFSLLLLLSLSLSACQSQSSDGNAPYKNIDVTEFKTKMDAPEVVILDVRTPEETAQGKIEGAVEIDFKASDFVAKLDQLDPEKTYLVYCRSGVRSGKTCKMMKEKGFREFYNLEG